MRVRYKLPNEDKFRVECDLSNTEAKRRFEYLKSRPIVIWGELVSEYDGSYMDVIDSFSHDTSTAYMMYELGERL